MTRALIVLAAVALSACQPLAYRMQPGTWLCPDGSTPDEYAPDANRDECTGKPLDEVQP